MWYEIDCFAVEMDGVGIDGCDAVSSQSTHRSQRSRASNAVSCVIFRCFTQVRLHSLEHAGMFISGPDGPEMTRLVEVIKN